MEYHTITGLPPSDLLDSIAELYSEVFGGEAGYLAQELPRKTNPLVLAVTDQGKVVGFKIGYERDNSRTFYSWLGAVHPDYRRQWIASTLMRRQHDWCRQHGYQHVITQTKNKWRDMLILNLRHGFDIIGTYTDEKGEPKIILAKSLNPGDSDEKGSS